MGRSGRLMIMVAAVIAVSCADPGGTGAPPAGGDAATEPSPPPSDAVAWSHLAMVEGTIDGGVAAAAVEDRASLQEAWRRYGFDGDPPAVDFTSRFVLLLLQPDDACPDELVGLDVVDGALEVTWLSPPGGCILPLIHRVHAVDVHRGHVPADFTVSLESPYEDGADEARIRLPEYRGDAPPPPTPPRSMTAEELDAVFAGHAVRRCSPADDVVAPLPPGTEVDEREEVAEEAHMQDVMEWLGREGWDLEREVVPIMDRRDNLRPHLRVNADRVRKLQREVDAEFGEGAVVVDANPYDLEDIADAQESLRPLMGGPPGPGRIMHSSGIPGPVQLGMVDPTREALDEVAATVDPSLVCIEPLLSGVDPEAAASTDG